MAEYRFNPNASGIFLIALAALCATLGIAGSVSMFASWGAIFAGLGLALLVGAEEIPSPAE